jgi:hypothetical protein
MMKRFEYHPHPHKPRNVNLIHQANLAASGFNTKLAVALTKGVGTMWCAYLFTGIGVGGLVGAVTNNVFLALVFGSVSSYLLQLVLLPVIMVGQNVLGAHASLMADEQFKTTQNTYHDIEQVMEHLNKQDEIIIKQGEEILKLTKMTEEHTALLLQIAQSKP